MVLHWILMHHDTCLGCKKAQCRMIPLGPDRLEANNGDAQMKFTLVERGFHMRVASNTRAVFPFAQFAQ